MARSVVNAERENIPGVAVTIKGFTEAARLAAKADGLTDLAVAEYPVAIGIQDPEEIRETIRTSLFAQIVDGLTGAANGASQAVRQLKTSSRTVLAARRVVDVARSQYRLSLRTSK